MDSIPMVAFAALFGAGYQVVATLFGAKIARIVWRDSSPGNLELLALPALALGVAAHALMATTMLAIDTRGLKYTAWLMLAVVLLDWRGTRQHLLASWKTMALVSMYGLLCFAILVAFHFGVARGDNLFWSIYKLTAITPGDSPQGLLQAQYLLHGQSLTGLRDFSLFDRPFLGGLISLAALTSIGMPPGTVFNDFPTDQAYSYIALWVWMNSAFALALLAIARRFATNRRVFVACALMLMAPFVVFNIIGAWPKLFAAYIACCAALLAVKGHWRWAVIFSGISFFTHGSFLWSHLSMCGVLALCVMFSPNAIATMRLRIWHSALLTILAIAFPAAWFLTEHYMGAMSPLRTYYLYDVPVNYGFAHTAEEIVKPFYSSTSPGNLALLPFMNLFKALLPHEILFFIFSFSYAGMEMDLRRMASALFYTQFNRPLFALCLTSGLVAMIGLRREMARNWHFALAVAAFFVLPLIPGMGLYRRNDHFITPVMVFAMLPLLIAFCAEIGRLSRRGLMAVVTLAMGEFALVYWSRYPSVRYAGEFYEYYLWLSLGALGLAYLATMRQIAMQGDVARRAAGATDPAEVATDA
jgi:hypothetical protein